MTTSIKTTARIGGLLYLLLIVLGFFGEFFARGGVIVPNNAVETAAHLKTMQALWRFGVLAEVLAFLSVTALTAIYYLMFRYVHEGFNILTTFLRLVATAIQSVAAVSLLQALVPVNGAAFLTPFSPGQLDALSMLAIRNFNTGYMLAILFFGFCFLFHGYLVRRSGFLPAILGWLIQAGGLMYFSYGIISIVFPQLAGRSFLALLPVAFIAEFSLCLWLIIKGVDIDAWKTVRDKAIDQRK